MLDILGITGPIYIAIALGYAVTRAGLFSRADMRVLGKFVIHVALPAMLFNALSQRRIHCSWAYGATTRTWGNASR